MHQRHLTAQKAMQSPIKRGDVAIRTVSEERLDHKATKHIDIAQEAIRAKPKIKKPHPRDLGAAPKRDKAQRLAAHPHSARDPMNINNSYKRADSATEPCQAEHRIPEDQAFGPGLENGHIAETRDHPYYQGARDASQQAHGRDHVAVEEGHQPRQSHENHLELFVAVGYAEAV
jgi:hypothetical protein